MTTDRSVIGIDRKPLVASDIALKADDAKVALRALLEKIESGKIVAEDWLFIYESGSKVSVMDTLDSGITLQQAVYMLEITKTHILSAALGLERGDS